MSIQLYPDATEEQRMMADAAIKIMEAQSPLPAVRERAEQQSGPDARELWRALGGAGCFGLLAGDEHGGGSLSGNGLADAAIIAAERGARLQPGPFVAALVAAGTLSRAGTTPLHADVLRALLAGDAMVTWAPCGLLGDAPGPGVNAVDTGDGVVLSGIVHRVQDAGDCDWILLSTGAGHFLLPRSADGLTLEKADGLDITRKFFTIELNDVRVPANAMLGMEPDGPALADWQAAVAAVLSAAESVGAMDANFSLALEYSKTRIAFGRPIGSFQGLKHLLARTSLALEMAKALVAGAAEALGSGAADGLATASIARAFTSENAVELTQTCFQVFGGIGFTWEHDQHLYMRRLASEAYLFGAPSWHRQRIWAAADIGEAHA
jgi:alkylation response protein AidB-like acyl-CoA dehydrogenase